MGHPGFAASVLLAAAGVAWADVITWTPARREAALIVLGESKGGRFNRRSWRMEWPEVKA